MASHDAAPDPRNEHLLVWVNGRLVPKAEAVVSVYDSGFMLGDGVWEGIRLHNGRWVFLAEHLDRLFEGARAIDLTIGMDGAGLAAALDAIAAANGMTGDAHARLMVTRGPKSRPFQDPRLSRSGPTIVIIAEHSRPAGPAQGLMLATVPQHRGLPLTQDPKLNVHSKLNCILALIAAQKAGADEALMLDPFGFVNTTNSCNFFIVRRGEVWTSTGDHCLNGVTRAKVIELCRAYAIPIAQRNYSLVETYSADEAFLTGTFGGLAPVAVIDGRHFPQPLPGPVTARLSALYKELVERVTEGP
ncbi:MAG TPA: aminotransferase class IV [Paracoccaceae bacterium]|nr:aminotransferase class IV [Paracoccaceae bacterium]